MKHWNRSYKVLIILEMAITSLHVYSQLPPQMKLTLPNSEEHLHGSQCCSYQTMVSTVLVPGPATVVIHTYTLLIMFYHVGRFPNICHNEIRDHSPRWVMLKTIKYDTCYRFLECSSGFLKFDQNKGVSFKCFTGQGTSHDQLYTTAWGWQETILWVTCAWHWTCMVLWRHGEAITIRLKLEKSSIQHTDGLGKSFPLLSWGLQ